MVHSLNVDFERNSGEQKLCCLFNQIIALLWTRYSETEKEYRVVHENARKLTWHGDHEPGIIVEL